MQRFFELGRRAYTTDLGGPQDILNALDIILNQVDTSVVCYFFRTNIEQDL